MISIKNLVKYEDLKEEHQKLSMDLDNLKLSKNPELNQEAVRLLKRLGLFLKHQDFVVEEKEDALEIGIVTNYKNSFIRGTVGNNSTVLNLIFNGQIIKTVEVRPRTLKLMGGFTSDLDGEFLKGEIKTLEREIKELEQEKRSYETEGFSYLVRIEGESLLLNNEDEVIANLFRY